MNVEQLLSKIPDKSEIVKTGLEWQVRQILELVAAEFPAGDIMSKAQDNGNAWKWYVEIPFDVPEILEHAVKDALADKWFDYIHFNGYGTQTPNYLRMSITVYKGDKPE